MGTLSLAAGYEVDDAVRINSSKLNTPVKNAFINSIYN